jgi:DNA-binding transcriptional MerR regulator
MEMNYPIRAVSKLTGLSVDTLRAWERRYNAISPGRSGRGRTYSESDIERLKLLREAVDQGHRIGEIGGFTDRQLRDLMGRSSRLAVRAVPARVESSRAARHDSSALIEMIDRFDYLAADRELGRLAMLAPARDLIYEVVVPVMQEVGDRWYSGTFSVAQEHMISSILRNLLGGLVRLYQSANTPASLLFATLPNEQHEFGILAAAMLAAAGGVGIMYLGPSLPVREILGAVDRTSPKAVVLGAKAAVGWTHSLRDLQALAERLPDGTELWIGGLERQGRARELKRIRALLLKDLGDFEQNLTRLGGAELSLR